MEIHFDVDKIEFIKFYEEEVTDYEWIEFEKYKKFFGFNIGKPEKICGFTNNQGKTIRDENDLILIGYKVYPKNERINHRVCIYPYVTITFVDGSTINTPSFQNNKEAKDWVEFLKMKTKNNFQTYVL